MRSSVRIWYLTGTKLKFLCLHGQIEQPFDPLPLDTFCKTVKKQLLVMPLCQQEARDLLAHQPKFIPPQTAAMVSYGLS